MATEKFIFKTPKGDVVPDMAVSPYDKKKEKIIRNIQKKADKLSKDLIAFKKELYEKGDALYTEKLNNKGYDEDGRKGNYSLFSYDKEIKLEMNIQESITFSDEINIAQKKLNEYIDDVTTGTSSDIMQLIHNAFKTKKGRLDKARIFSLFQIKITHPIWVEAMELIKDSIQTNDSRRYGTISLKGKDGDYNVIQLNFSAL